PLQFRLCHSPETRKICELVREGIIRVVEPESPAPAFVCPSMDTKRRSDCVSKFTGTDLVLTGKDLDSFGQPGTLDRESEPESCVVDVNTAISGEGRLLEEDPEVAATVRFFEGGFYAILRQFILKLQQVLDRVLVIRIDSNPPRPLRLRIDRIQAHGQF